MHLQVAPQPYNSVTPLPALCAQVALKALSLKGIKDWKQLELFQREAVVLQVCHR